jgi:predicted metalloprotease with PDZ domain
MTAGRPCRLKIEYNQQLTTKWNFQNISTTSVTAPQYPPKCQVACRHALPSRAPQGSFVYHQNLHAKYLPFILLTTLRMPAAPAIHYQLCFPNAIHHEAEIQATFTGLGPEPLHIFMSRSSPGRYALHEFAKNISDFRAVDASANPLQTFHDSPYSWKITPRNGTIVCSYTLFGDRVDGTYVAIDATHAHLNLPATLIWAAGLQNAPAELEFKVPADSHWIPHTQLIPNSDGTFSAPNMEWMMDSPVELSASPMREWNLDGVTFRLALHHQGSDADAAAFLQKCKRVVAEEKEVFGAFPKYDNGTYTFLVDYLPYASGDGMEHRDSTVISGDLDLSESASRAIGTVSHEFFHCWNVKRIRPKSLEPFDFEHADMSSELWFAEGFTNYYGNLILQRAGLFSLDEFISSMGHAVNAVLNDPGRRVHSAAGMSEQAPFVDAATSIDATDTVNDFISYYTYGEALAFGIDLEIRARYPGKSLDDWMRVMWREHSDIDRPYTMDDLEQTLAETTGDERFAHELFQNNIQGRQPLDYASLIAPAGLSLSLAHPGQPWLGVRLTPTGTGLALNSSSLRDSPAYIAGIDRGDEIRACGEKSVKTLSDLDDCLAVRKPGNIITIKVSGRTGLREVPVTLAQDPAFNVIPIERLGQTLTPAMRQFRNGWLSSRSRVKIP